MDLEGLNEEWLSLIRNGRTEEADKLYWEKLFPIIENNFLEKNTIKREYDWLILPCGLDASYCILLIKIIKPKNLYFICTKEFKELFLEKILEKSELKASRYIIDVVEYKGLDVADVYQEIKHHLDLFSGKNVVVDLTIGKRVLSVGAGIVGAFFGFDLVYIDEEWIDDIKRGNPGTEKLILVRNPFEVFGDLEKRQAKELFNNYNYGAAMFFFRRLKEKIVDPREIEIEELLSEAYLYWTAFNFKAALNKFESIMRKIKQYDIKINFDQEVLENNFEALKILNSEDITKPEKLSDNFNLYLIIDLYVNALRSAEFGRFEDAVSRLYRLLELISQCRLKDYRITAQQPKLVQYAESYKEITKQIYGIEKEPPFEIGVKDGHILLFILKDYIWGDKSLEDLKRFCDVLKVRDTSIIAHGLQLIGEKAFINLDTISKEFIGKICKKFNKDMKKLIKQHTFIKL